MICGAAIPPSRPPAEQNPKPVARIQVGYSSHVKLKTTANEPDIAIFPTKAFYQISSVFIGQFFKGSHRQSFLVWELPLKSVLATCQYQDAQIQPIAWLLSMIFLLGLGFRQDIRVDQSFSFPLDKDRQEML